MTIEDDCSTESDVYRKERSVEITYGSISGIHETPKVSFTSSRMELWFPTGFKHELKELYSFAWPLVLTMFLNFLIRVTGTMFSGQLGQIELDAVSMGVSIANVIGTSIGIGLIAACDTLFAQSYGSVNKKQVGVYLQTAIFISSLSCVLSWGLLFNTNYILLVCGQNPYVAKATEEFMYYFMPAIYFLFLFQLLQKYLQVQGIVIPVVIIGIFANVVNIGLQYVILNVLQLGIKGSAIGQSVSYFLLAALTLIYTLASGAYKKTWGGWSRKAFRDWGEFMKLGLSSIAMICLEWWTYEVSAFLTGILGNVQLGASSIAYQIWTIYASLPLGISSACAFRIGRYLGEERIDAALSVTRVSFIVAVSLSVISGLVTLAVHRPLPYLFSNDKEIVELARELLLILAIFNTLGCAKNILAGIIRGTGRQVAGGIVSFVAYFIFAMPIGIPLMFLTPLKAAGFWWGLLIGLAVACVSLMVIVWRTDWPEEARGAQIRAKAATRKRKRRESERIFEDYNESSGLLGNGIKPDMATDPGLSQSWIASTSLEFSTPLLRRNYWRKVLIEKTLIIVLCFVLFILGIILRFVVFIPPDLPPQVIFNTTVTGANFTWATPSVLDIYSKPLLNSDK